MKKYQDIELDYAKGVQPVSTIHKLLTYTTAILFIVLVYMAFIYSPVEKTMGPVQKIFYAHVPSAWIAGVAFLGVFILSIAFLITRKRIYDLYAGISAEIGVVFTTIVLTTGPIWGRSSWNSWWSWEPRLTTTLILWFIYLAYVMIRHMDSPWDKRARLAAVFGIIGFLDVPIVFFAIRWWNTKMHPIVFGEGKDQSGGGLEPEMLATLFVGLGAFTLLYIVLLQKGVMIEKAKIAVQAYKEKLQDKLVR
ncbi:MAG: cytochrome c assembly protein [Bacillales bacterium]|jgi:heme exporter protein C|nr:cytochrome c assembly protein [Bacillales bacterium]MDF2946695.1 cytochrome c assembly protein [Bacillales bacterium]